MNWEEASKHLSAPLDPSAIKPPPSGKHGEYVDGLHVIREANRIFGFDGWSYRITRLQQVSRIETPKPQVRVGYMATVEVNVAGVVREGSAVGSGMLHPDSEADAHEAAIKEAETDALKRAFRSFGNTFGLALYEKDKSKREVERPPSLKEKVEAAATVGEINELVPHIAELNDPEATKHLHAKALSIGLIGDREAGKYVARPPASNSPDEIPYQGAH